MDSQLAVCSLPSLLLVDFIELAIQSDGWWLSKL